MKPVGIDTLVDCIERHPASEVIKTNKSLSGLWFYCMDPKVKRIVTPVADCNVNCPIKKIRNCRYLKKEYRVIYDQLVELIVTIRDIPLKNDSHFFALLWMLNIERELDVKYLEELNRLIPAESE